MLKIQVPRPRTLLFSAVFVAVAFSALAALRTPTIVRYALPEKSTWWVAPSMLASKWGMFRKVRVDVREESWPTGKRALQALFEDRADIAYVAGPPVVRNAYDHAPLLVVAQTMSSNRIVHLLRQNDRADDWFKYPIGLARNTISEFYLISYLKKLGKLDLYRDGALQLVDRPNVEGNFISLLQNSTEAILLFEPFASLVNMGEPAMQKFSEITDPPDYQVTCYIVTTPEKWNSNRAGILSVLLALRRASEAIKRDPQKAWNDVKTMLEFSEQAEEWGNRDWRSVDFSLITNKETVRKSLSQDGDLGTEAGIFTTKPNFDALLSVIDEVDSYLKAEGS